MAVTWRRLVLESDSNWVDLTDGGATTLHKHPETGINFTDVTTGNVSTTAHGYAPKAVAPSSPTINYLGIANGETATAWKSASSDPGAAAAVLQTDSSGYVQVKKLLAGTREATSGSILIQADYDGTPSHTVVTEYSSGAIGLSMLMYQDNSASWLSSFAYGALARMAMMLSFNQMKIIAAPSQNVAVGTALTTQPTTIYSIDGAGAISTQSYTQLVEISAPSAGAANTVRIYAEDNGSGKTRLMALFASGAAQQIAIQP